MDGATVFDKNGKLIASGASIKERSVAASDAGARTRAARALSHFGLAVKVSADGEITGFGAGHVLFEVT